jgi:hypothetical protein
VIVMCDGPMPIFTGGVAPARILSTARAGMTKKS